MQIRSAALPPLALDGYVSGWRERVHARAAREAALSEQRWSRVRLVASVLVRDFGVHRVVVFGSLARGEARADSDVDLLVEGLPTHRLIDATATANRLMGDAMVDVVPVQLARPEVLSRALSEGVDVRG